MVARQERPNGLNVWRRGDLKSFRVLDVIWTDGTMPLILTYQSGRLGTATAAGVVGVIKLFVALVTSPKFPRLSARSSAETMASTIASLW
jgi:hypothetical protein